MTAAPEPSTGELVAQMSADVSRLVRDELELARAEVTGKAKHVGIGAGMFGAAGLLALYGAGALVAAGVLALSLALDAWLAALLVGTALLLVAGAVALAGRKQVSEGTPPVPTRAVENVKQDLEAVRPGHGADRVPAGDRDV